MTHQSIARTQQRKHITPIQLITKHDKQHMTDTNKMTRRSTNKYTIYRKHG